MVSKQLLNVPTCIPQWGSNSRSLVPVLKTTGMPDVHAECGIFNLNIRALHAYDCRMIPTKPEKAYRSLLLALWAVPKWGMNQNFCMS